MASVFLRLRSVPHDSSDEDIICDKMCLQNSKERPKLIDFQTVLLILLSIILVIVCVIFFFKENTPKCLTEECVHLDRYLSDSIDFSVDPCDDFYRFACGNWQAHQPIPDPTDESTSWDTYYKLKHIIDKQVKYDLERKEFDANKSKAFGKLKSLYQGCISENSRKLNDYSTLMSELNDLGGCPALNQSWNDQEFNLEDLIIKSIRKAYFPIIKVEVVEDKANVPNNIAVIRPFHFKHRINRNIISRIFGELNERFYSTEMDHGDLLYSGVESLQSQLLSVTPFEYKTEEFEISDFQNYRYNLSQLKSMVSGIDLEKILKSSFNSIEPDTHVLVPAIHNLINMADILASKGNRTIANYFCMIFVMNYYEYMSDKMDQLEDFSDEAISYSGTCIRQIQQLLPTLFGAFYVANHISKDDTKLLTEMIDTIQQIFIESIKENDWLDDITKSEAIQKVKYTKKNILWPKWTLDNIELDKYYNNINVTADNYLASVLLIFKEKRRKNFLTINSGLKIESWIDVDTTDISGLNFFQQNTIFIPAGVVQAPFFSVQRPMVFNFGFIGTTIGHELTHSLDPDGIAYDSDGQPRNWWTTDSLSIFYEKVQCFVDQYKKFRYPEQDLQVNGYKTKGENIADNVGIRLAYRAMKSHQKRRVGPFNTLPARMKHFTEEQLFFISFANKWCDYMEPSTLEYLLKVDEHSPDPVRVYGSIANFDKFADAFNCKVGDKMNPPDKCVLW